MIIRLMGALFAPKYPKFYTGRHRAPAWFRIARDEQTTEFV